MYKLILRILGILIVIFGVIYFIAPRETVKMPSTSFDFGDDLSNYLEEQESQYDDITPDTEKTIVWAGEKGKKTRISVVYVHGFSATRQELAPVPQKLAKNLGANLYMARLSGHGQPGEKLAEASAKDWLTDMQEALLIGEAIGEKVLVISASSGGTLAALAAADETSREKIDGLIFVSPNFAISNQLAPLLTWPAAKTWLPWIAGKEREWEPVNEDQEKYWTTKYPSRAVFPLAALVKAAADFDYSVLNIPALFYYAEDDEVVDATKTNEVVQFWGGDVEVFHPLLTEADDPSHHVIAGDILSPDQTDMAIELMTDWAKRNVK